MLLGFVGGSVACQAAHGSEARLSPWMRRFHLGLAVATGALFLIAFLTRGLTPQLLFIWGFVTLLVALSVLEVERYRLPERTLVAGAFLALLLGPGVTGFPWWAHLAGASAGGAILYLLSRAPGTGVQLPDVELGLFVGAVLGQLVIVALLVAPAARVFGLFLHRRLNGGKEPSCIPFAPYLAAGSALAVLAI